MAYIDYIPYDDASDELKALYDRLGGKDGTPANIVRIAGHNPKAMASHVDFYRAIMFGKSPLTRRQREMIAVVVSALNDCHYWIEAHWAALRSTKDEHGNPVPESLKGQLLKNYQTADISTVDKLILDYAEKITRNASAITREYIDTLRAQGFNDHILHDIVQVAAYFNYVNRLADALGVELEK